MVTRPAAAAAAEAPMPLPEPVEGNGSFDGFDGFDKLSRRSSAAELLRYDSIKRPRDASAQEWDV